MIEALQTFGYFAGMSFLCINLLLHLFIYPFLSILAWSERIHITDDSYRSFKLFDNFRADVWIPGLIFTFGLSLLAGVGVTILYYLQQTV